jgi:hypothetical protein
MIDLLAPVHQDASYHQFADPLGSFCSNAAFALVAMMGLLRWTNLNSPRRQAYLGCLLVAFGSAWYHADPSDASLLWDRLPMAVVFAAVFTEALGSFCSGRLRSWLWPLTAVAVGSVLWWHVTGDLRPYIVVQFGPMLALPLMIAWRREPRVAAAPWWGLLAWYAAAKVLELADVPIQETVGIGGHTLKHVAAAVALWAWSDYALPAASTSGEARCVRRRFSARYL